MQPEKTELDLEITDESVLNYLLTNPDFFVHHQDSLHRFRIPHDSGVAVSLIEKQVAVLRNKCGSLENSLRDLISVARENESLHQRLHGLFLQIISAPTLTDIVSLTRRSLYENFNADDVQLLLVASRTTKPKSSSANAEKKKKAKSSSASKAQLSRNKPKAEGLCVVASSDKRLKSFSTLFDEQQTQCGLPKADQLRCFLGEDIAHVGSAALIPLHHQRRLGVIMLASKDESRFASGKGVMFLNQLGEMISRRLHSYGPIQMGDFK